MLPSLTRPLFVGAEKEREKVCNIMQGDDEEDADCPSCVRWWFGLVGAWRKWKSRDGQNLGKALTV